MNNTARRTIVVEARKHPTCAAMLDVMAQTCLGLGYRVVRWRGPLSGRMPHTRYLPVCDLAILFNGAHRTYWPALARLRAWGAATLFVELGWHPQAGYYQVDPAGVNSAASWAGDKLEVEGKTPLVVRPAGDLLVLLQLDDDTQITERSEWFGSMTEFVRFMCANSALPVRVRPHPKAENLAELRAITLACGGVWDDRSSLAQSLAQARAVACVNSSAALEAMNNGLPVLCYGSAVYRHESAVYCLDADAERTRSVTEDILAGECSISQEAILEVVRRVVQKQWTVRDVKDRLPALLEGLLGEQAPVRPRIRTSDRVEKTLCWLTDLPPRLLYRSRLKRSA